MALSFGFLILLGALALCLPICHNDPVSVVDALFTATSAVCVTGLVVVDTGTAFSHPGQFVILALIQAGGLGMMIWSSGVLVMLGKRLGLRQRASLKAGLPSLELSRVRSLVKGSILFTLACESLGALALWGLWQSKMGSWEAFKQGVFHSVSAFCNAGFSLWPDSLMGQATDGPVNLVVMGLIILGGLGYLVVLDLALSWRRGLRASLQTRLTLWITVALIGLGAAAFFLLERGNPQTLGQYSRPDQLLVSLFQSVTTRTAGFNTVDIGSCSGVTLQFLMMLMLIGGGPGSTAGGLKVTTLAVLLVAIWASLKGRRESVVWERKIPSERVLQSLAILGLLLSLVWMSSTALSSCDQLGLTASLFESVSAAATVGLSTGVTGALSLPSKLLLCFVMFVGRVGPLTLAAALLSGSGSSRVRYVREDVSVG